MRTIYIIHVLIFLCCAATAQLGLTNAGNLQVHSGATIAAYGDFTNTGTAALINNGTFSVRGNLSNNEASMTPGSGSLNLNGITLQTLSGSQTFAAYNITTNNASGFTLNNNLSVSALHTFAAGVITTSATPNYVIYESGASHTGSADSRHVNGWVRRLGSTAFTFPVGNGSYLRNISISNLSSASVFDARHHMVTANTSNIASPLFMVDANEYWTLTQVSGGTAEVQLNWDNSKVPFPNWLVSSIRVAGYQASLWNSRGGSASGNSSTTGSIASPSISAFGAITFGSISATLPMNLLGLSATREEGHNLVRWTTEQEINVEHYEVERMDKDGLKLYRLGSVAANNSSGVSDYHFADQIPFNNSVHYRIRTVDIDGKFAYSNVVTLFSVDHTRDMKLLNNPAKTMIQVKVPALLSGRYGYQLLSQTGQIMQSGLVDAAGGGVYSIYLKASVNKGTYVLQIANPAYSFSCKVIVQ